MLKIDEKEIQGKIEFGEKIVGRGKVGIQSWYLSSTSIALVLEIAEDPEIEPEDLPLVGYGCGGWIFEHEYTSSESEVVAAIKLGLSQFKQNSLEYVPAVTCACAQ
ncbi:hypothetical protein KP803_05630 [Vibrio sp. ZSDE26]|uniref:Uncharacterized protein n=1 Tax=Vibrio amylolyticus TaxID=2847292 RepID=A0A9X1XJD9_9VIBR|nr:hypothetical protein [Vibrio amylolyticus]MCK6262753.1 hypothetical protein [Vibrio amylolyticus]